VADRDVTVDLNLDNKGYIAGLLESAAATRAFGDTAGGSSRQVDRLSGRLRIYRDLALSIGPALVPIGAIGVPAIMGLASATGFAAVGAGTALLAFEGFGDALKKMNAAAVDPTAAKIKNARIAMDHIGVSAATFVIQIREMIPALKSLRDAAADELFPHLSDSLDDVETILPKLEKIVSAVADAVGQGAEDTAASFASDRWSDFFTFIETEAPPAITSLTATVGDLTHGLAELWMAFDPLNDDTLNWMANAADNFDRWAQGLSQTKDFQEFTDYIEAQGPQVGETLSAIANALLQIVEATAPIGGPVLQILETFAKIISTIADSDIGTPLIAAIAAMAALTRGQQLFTVARDSAFGKRAISGLAFYGNALSTVNTAQNRATMSVKEFAAAQQAHRVNLLKGAAGIAALGLVVSGYAEKAGYGTAATLGLTGAMIGGAGGAIAGGLLGAGLDIKGSLDNAADSVKRWHEEVAAASKSGDIESLRKTLEDSRTALDDFSSDLENNTFTSQFFRFFDPQDLAQDISELDGGSTVLSRYADAAAEAQAATYGLSGALIEIGRTAGDFGAVTDEWLVKTLTRARPAMTALGISTNDLIAAWNAGDGSLSVFANQINDWNAAADTSTGRAKAVAEAIAALGDETDSTATKADNLKTALDALFDPASAKSAAWDQWLSDLRDINDNLSEHGRALKGDSKAATENREVIRGYVSDLKDVIETQAAAGVKGPRLTEIFKNQAAALVDFAVKAKLNKKELEDYLATLELTPENIKTIIGLYGAEKAKKDAEDVKKGVENIPEKKSTDLMVDNKQAMNAIHATQASLNAMHDKVIHIQIQQQQVKLGGGGQSPQKGDPGYTPRAIMGRTTPGSFYFGRGFGPSQPLPGDPGGGPVYVPGGGLNNPLPHGGPQFDWQKEQQQAIREAFRNLALSLADGAQAIRQELKDLKQDLKDVGGVWNDAMRDTAKKIVELAKQYDAQAKLLEQQEQVLDDLNSTLDDMAQKMQSFIDQVSGNFLNDPFGNGLSGFFSTTGQDAANATMFAQVLKQLSAMGLDGPAYEALAASGDLVTASQLLASGTAGVNAFEAAWEGRAMAAGQLGNQAATDSGMVGAVRAQALAVSEQTKVIEATKASMDLMNSQLNDLRRELRNETGQRMAGYNGEAIGKVLNGVAANAWRKSTP
jgi:hypothetical protein